MCGIGGIVQLRRQPIRGLRRGLDVMDGLLAHRGPDGSGTWCSDDLSVGLMHRRLAVIDVSAAAAQPMTGANGAAIVYNGEIYNYLELRQRFAGNWPFVTNSDTETILAAYAGHGLGCLQNLRGMFAFALWDGDRLFCARDRFGIKPFYYVEQSGHFIFASEAKALLPFIDTIETDEQAFAEYVTFQFSVGENTLFKGVKQLLPGHALVVENGSVRVWRYWDVNYAIDHDHNEGWFRRRLIELVDESMALHLRSDVPVGAYLSGGVDSSLISMLASREQARPLFHGKFSRWQGYDESPYAEAVADACGSPLLQCDIGPVEFRDNIENIIWHLDFPIAGPGAFPQYMVSRFASDHVKVVLGGQGGDEIFGGYARYLIAYFEQCIKAAIEGTYKNGNFVVTAESIIPNLTSLAEYVPLIRKLWSQNLFGSLDERYFRLIDRAADMKDEIRWGELNMGGVSDTFSALFNSEANVGKRAYLDKMTHFDFKTLLPALLHVEDRMSMAHGLESRVPFLDHPLVEFVATVPADIKFKDGRLKHFFRESFRDALPQLVVDRRDKMGFPVPLQEWFRGDLSDFLGDVFHADRARCRRFIDSDRVIAGIGSEDKFSRKTWGLLCLELWHNAFHDQAHRYHAMAADVID